MLKIFYHQKKFLSISKTGKTWHTIIGQQPKAIPPERWEKGYKTWKRIISSRISSKTSRISRISSRTTSSRISRRTRPRTSAISSTRNKPHPPRGGYISEASVFFCRGFLLLQLRTFYDRILLYKAHIKMKGMNFSGKEKFI